MFVFPYIRQVAVFNRIKVYQTVLVTFGVGPYFLIQVAAGNIHPSEVSKFQTIVLISAKLMAWLHFRSPSRAASSASPP